MSGGNWKEMFYAVELGDKELVAYHLKTGVDPNYQHPEIMASALVDSIRFNHLEIAQLLLKFDADPTIKEMMGGDTPMSVAKALNNKDAIALLKGYIDKKG